MTDCLRHGERLPLTCPLTYGGPLYLLSKPAFPTGAQVAGRLSGDRRRRQRPLSARWSHSPLQPTAAVATAPTATALPTPHHTAAVVSSAVAAAAKPADAVATTPLVAAPVPAAPATAAVVASSAVAAAVRWTTAVGTTLLGPPLPSPPPVHARPFGSPKGKSRRLFACVF